MASPCTSGLSAHSRQGMETLPAPAAWGQTELAGRTVLSCKVACDNQLQAGWVLTHKLQHKPFASGCGNYFCATLSLILSKIFSVALKRGWELQTKSLVLLVKECCCSV